MTLIIVFLQVITTAAVSIAILWVRKYLPSYLTKKGENLATKEDIAAITTEMERARVPFASAVEEVKTALNDQSRASLERQRLYLDFAEASADVFLSGRPATSDQKSRVLAKYGGLVLSAPDSVIRAVNRHLDLQLLASGLLRSQGGIPAELQPALRGSYAGILLEMRREGFFPETQITAEDYRFISIEDAPEGQAGSPQPAEPVKQIKINWGDIARLRELSLRLQAGSITDAEIAELFSLLPSVPDGEIFTDPAAVFLERGAPIPGPSPARLHQAAASFVRGETTDPPEEVVSFVRGMAGTHRWLEVRVPGTERHYGLRF